MYANQPLLKDTSFVMGIILVPKYPLNRGSTVHVHDGITFFMLITCFVKVVTMAMWYNSSIILVIVAMLLLLSIEIMHATPRKGRTRK